MLNTVESIDQRQSIMLQPLVREQVRHNAQQAFLNALSLSLAVMMILTVAGTTIDRASHPNKVIVVIRTTVAAMAWLATGTALIFMVIHRLSEVKARTREFAILRMLGGSFRFIATLLWQETILIVVPGTIAGILLAYLHKLLIDTALQGLFALHNPYAFWLPAGMIAGACFFMAGLCAAWMATRMDVIEALACEG